MLNLRHKIVNELCIYLRCEESVSSLKKKAQKINKFRSKWHYRKNGTLIGY